MVCPILLGVIGFENVRAGAKKSIIGQLKYEKRRCKQRLFLYYYKNKL